MSPEKTDNQRASKKEVGRRYVDMILIEQLEARGMIADFKRAAFDSRSLELGRRAMHRFDHFTRRIIRRASGLERSSELVELFLKCCHGSLPPIIFKAAGPVSRILSAGLLLLDGHSSGPRIAARL